MLQCMPNRVGQVQRRELASQYVCLWNEKWLNATDAPVIESATAAKYVRLWTFCPRNLPVATINGNIKINCPET